MDKIVRVSTDGVPTVARRHNQFIRMSVCLSVCLPVSVGCDNKIEQTEAHNLTNHLPVCFVLCPEC